MRPVEFPHEKAVSSSCSVRSSEAQYVPPVSMPFTAASDTARSTFLAASFAISTGPFRVMGEVLKSRTWRAICVRNMVEVGGLEL